MQHTAIKHDPLHKGSSQGFVHITVSMAHKFHAIQTPEMVIYRYPVPDKAVDDLIALFPSHDICIMEMTTPDGKSDHHPSQFEAILKNALVTVYFYLFLHVHAFNCLTPLIPVTLD
jgi:hypothetical protein